MYVAFKSNEMLLYFPGATDMSFSKVASTEDLWEFLFTVPGVIYTGVSTAANPDIGVTYRGEIVNSLTLHVVRRMLLTLKVKTKEFECPFNEVASFNLMISLGKFLSTARNQMPLSGSQR